MKTLFAFLFCFMLLPYGKAQNVPLKIDSLISAYVNLNKFNGVALVAYRGKIIFEKGYGWKDFADKSLNNANTIFQIGSITKEFTAAVILKLIAQKKLGLEDKLSKFYPDFPKGDSISIKNLLTHTSGIPDYTHRPDFEKISVIPTNEENMLAQLKQQPLEFSPGERFKYSNSGYVLLGYIIEKVTHQHYERVVREMLLSPLKMENTGFDYKGLKSANKSQGYTVFSVLEKKVCPVIDSSEFFAAGAMYSTVGDLYKWHQGWQQGLVVTEELVKAAYTPFKGTYGYGWDMDSVYNKQVVGHSGAMFGFRAKMVRIPSDDLFIILLNNRSDDPYLAAISKGISAIVYQQPYVLPVPAARLSRKELKIYTGRYEFSSTDFADILLVDGHLMGRSPRRTLELIAREKDHFWVMEREGEEGEITFGRNGKGEVIEIYLNKGKGEIRVGKKTR
ncbi:serine hydrolase domain-containing protein [Chitinophaga qingshengii]|uniref:Beta-lactamase family protein n=1 Tax=Chitinophaga qingshengii TaxID=1569794 RepID=A0ABR7TWH7_9BACT|nr:serine hydrolase domain-containing protein [Chitinophaga qingshengii]MBC9934425.1 beta-lactamase family protein [Chitinophaga qingshengii]